MNNIIRRVCFSLAVAVFSLGLSTSTATAATRLTPAHLYNWARTGNTPRLQQFRRYINLQDRNQNTALCLAQHAQDRNAYALLLKFGASTDVPCHDDDDPICAVIAGEKTKLTPAGWLLLGAGAAAGAYLLLDDDDDDDDNPVCPTSHPFTEQCQTGNGYNTNQDMKDVAGLKCYSCAYSCDTAAGWYTSCPAGKSCDKSITLPDGSDICYQVTGCPVGYDFTDEATCKEGGYICSESAPGSDCWKRDGSEQCPITHPYTEQCKTGAEYNTVQEETQSGDTTCYSCAYSCNTATGWYTTCPAGKACDKSITLPDGSGTCYQVTGCPVGYDFTDEATCKEGGYICSESAPGSDCWKRDGSEQCPITHPYTEQCKTGAEYNTDQDETQSGDTTCYSCAYSCNTATGWYTTCPAGKACNNSITLPDGSGTCYQVTGCPAGSYTDKATCETENPGYTCVENATGSDCWIPNGKTQCPSGYDTQYQSPADCGVGGAQGWKVEFNGQSGDEKCGKCVPLACDTNTALKCNDGTYTEVTQQTITDYNGNTPCYTCKFSCKAPYYSDPGQCASGHACTALPEENGLTCYKEGGLLQCPIDFRDPECLDEGKGFTVSEETQELDDGTLCYKCDYACADDWTAGPCPDGKICTTINTPVQCYTNAQCPADYTFTDKATCETGGYICKESATGSGCWKRDGSEDCPDDSQTTICSTGEGYDTKQEGFTSGDNQCYRCDYSCDTAAGWYTTCPAGKSCNKSITLPDGSDICYQVTGCPAGSYTNKATCETENPGYTCVENATGSDCWIPNGKTQCPSGYDTQYQSPADCGVGGAQGWKVEFNGQSGDEKCGKCVPLACDTNTALKCNDGTYTEVTQQTITDYNGNTPCYTCKFSCKAPYYSDPDQCASGHACTALPEENGLTCYKEGGLLQCPTDYKASACTGGTGYTAQETDKIQLNDGSYCYKCSYACADGWTAGSCPTGKTCSNTISTPVQCYTGAQCPSDYPFSSQSSCTSGNYSCTNNGANCWKRTTCPTGYTKGLANCSNKTQPSGWNYTSVDPLTDGSACGKCTEKSCADGYTAGLESCPGEGYTYSSNGYAGDKICGKCTAKTSCPVGTYTDCTDLNSGLNYTSATNGTISGYIGNTPCYTCKFSCKAPYYGQYTECTGNGAYSCKTLSAEQGVTCYQRGTSTTCPAEYPSTSCSGGTGYTASSAGSTQLDNGTTCYKCSYACADGWTAGPCPTGKTCSNTISTPVQCYTGDQCPSDYPFSSQSSCTSGNYSCTNNGANCWKRTTCPTGYTKGLTNCSNKTQPSGWNYTSVDPLTDGSACGKCTEKSCADGYTAGLESCPGEGYTYSSNGYAGDKICGKCTAKTSCPVGTYTDCTDLNSGLNYTSATNGTISGYIGNTPCYTCKFSCKAPYYSDPDQCASGHACTALPEENGLTCYKEGGLLQCPTDYKASACTGGTGYTAQETDKIQLNDGSYCYKCSYACADGWTAGSCPTGKTCSNTISTPVQCYTGAQCPSDYPFSSQSSCTSDNYSCTNNGANCWKRTTCPTGYTKGLANCSNKTQPSGWNYTSVDPLTDGSACGKCTEKSCADGYTAGLESCPGEGYTYSSNGYAGDKICGKCTAKTSCPVGTYTDCTDLNSGLNYTSATNGTISGYIGNTPCYTCKFSCKAPYYGQYTECTGNGAYSCKTLSAEQGVTCYQRGTSTTCPAEYPSTSCSGGTGYTASSAGSTQLDNGTTCYKCSYACADGWTAGSCPTGKTCDTINTPVQCYTNPQCPDGSYPLAACQLANRGYECVETFSGSGCYKRGNATPCPSGSSIAANCVDGAYTDATRGTQTGSYSEGQICFECKYTCKQNYYGSTEECLQAGYTSCSAFPEENGLICYAGNGNRTAAAATPLSPYNTTSITRTSAADSSDDIYGLKSNAGITNAVDATTGKAGSVTIEHHGTGTAYGLYAAAPETSDAADDSADETSDAATGDYALSAGSANAPLLGTQPNAELSAGKIINESGASVRIHSYNGGDAVGIYAGSGLSVTNDGSVAISGNAQNAYGIYGAGQNDITNAGDISVTGENAYGIYVEDGAGTTVTNTETGSITVNSAADGQAHGIFINQNAADATVNNFGTITVNGELREGNSGITLNGAKLRNFSLMSFDGNADLNALGGKIYLEDGGVYEAQSLKGDLNVGVSAVTGSNLDTYTQENSLRTEDADELNLASESALFNASKHKNNNGGYDVVLNRRAFNEFTENASLGQYLEQNYQEGNLTELYDSVKSETDDFAARQNIADKTGFDTMLNFADENFQVLRSLNRSMADTILKPSDEPYRVLAGYDNFNLETDNKGLLAGYELSSNSMYTFGDKRLDNKNRLGLGLSYTNLSSSYEEGGDRDLNIFTVFMPYLHKFSDNLRLASVLSFGYGYGEYDRGSDRESDITDFFYGLTNELRYTIDLNGFAELEPALMLNALGYSEDGFDERNAEDALVTKRTNNLSVEAGIGLFLKKEVKMEKYGKLGFKIGGVYYHEFAEPYDDIRARHNGASGWYSINDYANLYQRDRAVLEAAVDYEYKDIALYAKYNRLIQKNDPQLFDLGVKYKF